MPSWGEDSNSTMRGITPRSRTAVWFRSFEAMQFFIVPKAFSTMKSVALLRHGTRALRPPTSRMWSRLSALIVRDTSAAVAFSTTPVAVSPSKPTSTRMAPCSRATFFSSREMFQIVAAAYSLMPDVSVLGGAESTCTKCGIVLHSMSAGRFSGSELQFLRIPRDFSRMLGFSFSSRRRSFGKPPHVRSTCLLSPLMEQIHSVDVIFSNTLYLVRSRRSTKSSMPPNSRSATLFWSVMAQLRMAPAAFSWMCSFLPRRRRRSGSRPPSFRSATLFSLTAAQFHNVPEAFSTTASLLEPKSAISGLMPPSCRISFLLSVSTARFHSAPAAFSCTLSLGDERRSTSAATPPRLRTAALLSPLDAQFHKAPAAVPCTDGEGKYKVLMSFSMPLHLRIMTLLLSSRVRYPSAIVTFSTTLT
eukprot:PhM_4_TR18624/c3_g1_i1/m.27218